MARTQVLGFTTLEEAQSWAAFYSKDHKVMIIGPTDQVVLAKGDEDGVAWRSGPDADFYVVVATKDAIVGPGGGAAAGGGAGKEE